MIVGLILWAELFGFYLLFAAHVGTAALLAGGEAAVAAAALGTVLHRAAQHRRRPRNPGGPPVCGRGVPLLKPAPGRPR